MRCEEDVFIPTKENYTNMTPTEFEKYVLDILEQQFTNDGVENYVFEHNVTEKTYDGNYQIDGKISFSLMGVKFITIIECKKFNYPIKRDHIVTLYNRICATGANKGIFVTTSYFQSGAIQYASKHGIALISIVDGKMQYETRSMNEIDYFEWFDSTPYMMILQTCLPDKVIRCSRFDKKNTNDNVLLNFITEEKGGV